MLYQVQVKYSRHAEDGVLRNVKELYVIKGESPEDVTKKIVEIVAPYADGGDVKIPSCQELNVVDVYDNSKEIWWKAKIQVVAIDGEKEKRVTQTFLVSADTLQEAAKDLEERFKDDIFDHELSLVQRTNILEVYMK